MNSFDPKSLPRPLRYPRVIPIVHAFDRLFYEDKLTGSFCLRFHYVRGVLKKIRIQHPEHEIEVADENPA